MPLAVFIIYFGFDKKGLVCCISIYYQKNTDLAVYISPGSFVFSVANCFDARRNICEN